MSQDFDHQEENFDQKCALTDQSYHFDRARRYFQGRAIFYQLTAMLIAFSLGFLVAVKLGSIAAKNHGPVVPSSSKQLFIYNRTFANPPSATTNQAWTDLFPTRGGFLVHPMLAPNLSVVAVFHQLHCIDAIRHGYYMAAGAADLAPSTTVALHQGDPRHVRHCLDYLRQAIMCHADTNMEPVIPELGGAKGFGVEHSCGRYDELVEWITQWE